MPGSTEEHTTSIFRINEYAKHGVEYMFLRNVWLFPN
jgi:hypothetical protein